MKECPDCGEELILLPDMGVDDVAHVACPECGIGFNLCPECGHVLRRIMLNQDDWVSFTENGWF